MRRFVVYLYVFTALTHVSFFVFVHDVALSLVGAGPALAVASIAAVALVLALHHRMRLAFADRPVSPLRSFLERAYFAHWGGAIGGAILLPFFYAASAFGVDLFVFAYPIGLGFASYGVFYRARVLRTQVIEIAIPGLGPAFDGFRIAQLSDIHVGSLLPPEVARRWVDQTNALGCDLVALTGDYVTSGSRFHRAAAEELARLRAPEGVLAVMGNHDAWDRGEPIRGSFKELGIVLLENESRVVARGDDRITFVGVDDIFSRRDDVDASVRGVDFTAPVIALAHDPHLFRRLAAEGIDFVMSGHTHWGQVAPPFLAQRFNFIRIYHEHASGMCTHGASKMYVHPGCGTTGVPLRLGVAPEIAVFVLRPGGARAEARSA